MITGMVVDLRPVVCIEVRAPGRPFASVECVIDTGFEGALALPTELVASLDLPYLTGICANLADGTDVSVDAHRAGVLWNGRHMEVAVLAMGHRPLLGSALLAGTEIVAQFVDHGLVTIDTV